VTLLDTNQDRQKDTVDDTDIESRILMEISRSLTSLDLEDVLKRVVEAAVYLSSADEGSLVLLDEETEEPYVRAAKGFGETSASTFRGRVTDGIVGEVVLTGQPVLIAPDSDEQTEAKSGCSANSLLDIPVRRGDSILGVLCVYNTQSQQAFTHHHLSLLAPLASYAAIAIENARLFQETSQLLTEADAMFEAAMLFSETLDSDELLYRIAHLTRARLESASHVVIHLLDPYAGRLERKIRAPASENGPEKPRGFAIGEGIAGQAVQNNCLLNVPNVRTEATFVVHHDVFGSLLVAPISRGNVAIGTISVASPRERAFTRRHERLLVSLANLAGISIENARLLEAEKAQATQLGVVAQLAKKLTSILDLDELLQQTVTLIREAFGFEDVAITLVDVSDGALVFKAAAGAYATEREPTQAAQLGEGLVSWAAQTGQMALSNNVSQDSRYTALRLSETKSELAVPLKYRDRVIGVLDVQSQSFNSFTPHDALAMETLADQAALAIQNARQFEQMHERLRRRVRELQSLQDIDRLISCTADLDTMLKCILDAGLKLVGAEFGNVVLYDKETKALTPRVSHPEGSVSPEKYQPGLTAWVAREMRTARIGDLSQSQWAQSIRGTDIRAELAAPIVVGEELVGVINIGGSVPDAFTEEDESLLDILATQTAVAIRTARYYQEMEDSRLRSFKAERIATMSDVGSNMVHRMNNSVGAIRVLVQQLRLKIKQDSLDLDYLSRKLDEIQLSAEQALEMASKIVAPRRNLDLGAEPIDVNDCIKVALRRFGSMPATIQIILNLDNALPPAMATQQLEEVFRNLISNAVEAMEGSGTLQISSGQTTHTLEVAVIDSGPGIPKGLTKFDIFGLGVSSKVGGLGYGLWWSRTYLSRFGGDIRLESGLGSGCKFAVSLPLQSAIHST
jgi:GAF domain-containing protein